MAGPPSENGANEYVPAPTPTAASTPAAPLSSHETIHRWLTRTYLAHDYHEDRINISVQDFLHMPETSSHGRKNWLSEDQVALPMVLQLQNRAKRSDIVILPPPHAFILASIALNTITIDDFLIGARGHLAAMNNAEARWIVIPCNDGMIEAEEAMTSYKEAQETASKSVRGNREESQASRHTRATRSATATLKAKGKDVPSTIKGAAGENVLPGNGPSKSAGRSEVNLGMHWGMIVIDKENNDARFFDGDLKNVIVRKNGSNRLCPRSRWKTAIAAGKILCGYDTVMGREKGLFKTGTLRHVPHERLNNIYRGDEGSSCAPWVFAMFRYILQNTTFLTDEGGLKKAFRRSQKQQHVNGLGFHSKNVRREMQNLIAEEARRQEASTTLPHKLDPDILQSLKAITPDQLLYHLKNIDNRNTKRRRGGSLPSREGNNNDDSGDDDDEQWPPDYKGLPFACLEEHIPENPGLTKEQRLQHAYELLTAMQQSMEDGMTNGNGNDENGNDENGSAAGTKDSVIAARYATLQNSEAFQAIAEQVVDFAPMSAKHVNEWARKNSTQGFLDAEMDLWQKKMRLQRAFGGFEQLTKDVAGEYRHHLRLNKSLGHMGIVEVLEGMTDHIAGLLGQVQWYPDYYLQQHGVIPADGDKSNKDTGLDDKRKRGNADSSKTGASRRTCHDDTTRGDQKKDDSDSERSDFTPSCQEASQRSRKPSRKAGNTGSDGGEDTSQANRAGTGPPFKSPGAPHGSTDTIDDTPNDNRPNDDDGDSDNNTVPDANDPKDNTLGSNNNNIWNRPHDGPLGLLDFRTMAESELEEYKTPERLADPRLFESNVNTTSWRAFLHVTISDGRFRDESDYNCLEIWLDDSIVFSDADRKLDWTKSTNSIRSRMEQHYCRTPSLTDTADDIFEFSETEEELSEEELDSVSSDVSEASEDASKTTDKRKRDVTESTSEDALPSKRTRRDRESTPDLSEDIDNGRSQQQGAPEWDVRARRPDGKRPNRDTQQQRAMHGMQGLEAASQALSNAADGLKDLTFPADAASIGNASGVQASSGAPDGGDGDSSSSDASSPLSSVPESESESAEESSSGSGDSESDDDDDAVHNSKKRDRDSEDDETGDEGKASKKPKTRETSPSHDFGEQTDATSSGVDDPSPTFSDKPDGQITTDEPAADPQVDESFGSQATVEDPTIEIYIGREVYLLNPDDTSIFLPWDETRQGWPSYVTELPDFAHIDASDFTLWYKANRQQLKTELSNRGNRADMVTCRALLHIKFKKTFLHEPDANFSSVWLTDRTVFSTDIAQELLAIPDPAIRNGQIRRRMMAAYEPEMLGKIETSDVYKPGVPNVLDIHVIGASRSTIAAEDVVVDDSLLRLMTAKEAHLAKREAERKAREDARKESRRETRERTPDRKYGE